MAGAVLASSESPVPTKPSGKLPVLQIDQPVRFLNSDGLPSNIPSGTYLVAAKGPDTLQLISTSTGETQNLHSTILIHTESLTVPYPFLIEEAGKQGHVHLILLLPDGQGLDAESLGQEVLSRGAGNPTRSLFIPTRRYTGIVMQQGRVATDADLNEQEAVSSSAMSRLHSNVAPSYGRVTLEQGRIQLDAKARQSLLRRCRICAKKQ